MECLNINLKQIINYVVQLFYKSGRKYTCSRTKIGKILTIVAFVYAIEGKRLFEEKIYKYSNCGTSINEIFFYLDREVYLNYEYFDTNAPIDISFNDNVDIPERYTNIDGISVRLKSIIETVFLRFGGYDTKTLGDMLCSLISFDNIVKSNEEIDLNILETLKYDDFISHNISNDLINFLYNKDKLIILHIFRINA